MVSEPKHFMTMNCSCGSEEINNTKLLKIKGRHKKLRKQYNKLLGITMELTQIVEEFVRGERTPNVSETLVLCSKIYPSLFRELSARTREMTIADEGEEDADDEEHATQEPSEKSITNLDTEYVEGFWSRPRIPRTPNYHSKN